MYNVTPELVTSAFFTLQDPLLIDGIPASAVRCLQRLPHGKVDITLDTQEIPDKFVRKSAFILNRRPYAAHPAQRCLTFVTILDPPYEIPLPFDRKEMLGRGTVFNARKTEERPQVIERRRPYTSLLNVVLLCARILVSFGFILYRNPFSL